MSDWEKSVIATVLSDPPAMESTLDLRPSDFTGPNQSIWAEIMVLYNRGQLDSRALLNSLRSSPDWTRLGNGRTPEEYLAEVMGFRGDTIDVYVEHVLEAAVRRALQANAALIAAEAADNRRTAADLLDYAEQRILSLRRDRSVGGMTMSDLIGVFIPRLDGLRAGTIRPAWTPDVVAVRDIIQYAEPAEFILVAARPGEGKCLGKGTKVVMHDGTMKPVEEIRIGDMLLGPDSLPRRVLSTTQGRDMMYWVRQNRGIDYRVNANHVLSLKRSKNEGGKKHGEISNLSVRTINRIGKSYLARWKGYKVGVEFSEQATPLEPYFVGLWIGDGTRGRPDITKPDQEVVEYLSAYAERRGDQLRSDGMTHAITRQRGYRIGETVRGQLNRLDILHKKRIPDLYLRNSRQVRLSLLAGIIDSDGSQTHNGIEITMQDPDLIQQIKWLADSLGFRTGVHKPRIVSCQTGARRIAYRMTIHGDFSDCPIRIKRKIPRKSSRHVDWQMTGIRIEQDKIDDYFGFELDGDGLFLLEDFTVTHNSSYLRYEADEAAVQGQHVTIFNAENDPIEYPRYLIAKRSGVDSMLLKSPRMMNEHQLERVKEAAEALARTPIRIYNAAGMNASQIVRLARKSIVEDHTKLIMMDYIQLVSNGIESRVNDISETSRLFRVCALQYGVPWMVAAQLSRAIETRSRDDANPKLSDLRDSGSLEQDATIVMFPRSWGNAGPVQYGQYPENLDRAGHLLPRPKAVSVWFHVLKNRNGDTGVSDEVKWSKHLDKFQTLTEARR
jgi:replicative DNA helicase